MQDTRERAAARYVDDIPAASVITLNGISAAQATTDFMLAVTDLSTTEAVHHFEFVRNRTAQNVMPRRDPECGWCGDEDVVGERLQLHALLSQHVEGHQKLGPRTLWHRLATPSRGLG